MANTGKIAVTIAIVMGLWGLLIASSMTFNALTPPGPEIQARKMPAASPATHKAGHDCDCIFTAQCKAHAPSRG